MIIYLSIIYHKDNFAVVENNISVFEQSLEISLLSEPGIGTYWKDSDFNELRVGMLTNYSLNFAETQIERLCSGFGSLILCNTSLERNYSVYSSLEEMINNHTRAFITICIPN